MADAEWIAQLVEHGLVRPTFVPPKEIRELRDLTRYRKAQIDERGREAQRLDKVLQDAGVKLSSVAIDILGKSGRGSSRRWCVAPATPKSSPNASRLRPVCFWSPFVAACRGEIGHQIRTRVAAAITSQTSPSPRSPNDLDEATMLACPLA